MCAASQQPQSPSPWPVEPYTRNTGTVGRRRIVFVGASYKFCHKVLRDMLLVGGFDDVHLVVHDIDPEPMNIVADLLERIARQQKSNVRVSRTLDRREALRDADAVIISITTGGREADMRSWEVCAKYGIPVAVGDTMGPAALARCLRSVPVVCALAKEMEELCPRATVLNFSNPMSVLTGAIARHCRLPTFGLCHSADELWRFFSKVFGVPKTDIDLEVGGVNHQAFVTRVLVRGEDRTRDMLAAIEASAAKMEDTVLETRAHEVELQKDICRVLGVWPSTGHTHLAEFYHFFMTPRRIDRLRKDLRGTLIPGRQPFGRTLCPEIIRRWAYGPEPVGDLHLLTTEHAHELLYAFFTGEPFTRVANVLNTGPFIEDIPRHACVEARITVAGPGITGRPMRLPPAAHSLVQRWTTIHELSMSAALNCDRDAARQALFLDPHMTDLYDIEPMLEDMLQALRPWLPAGWFGR